MEQTLIEAVRALSSARAQIDCAWEDVNDCLMDGDILEFLSEHQFDFNRTMKAISNWVYEAQYSGHQREYNPDNYRGI